MAREFEFDDLKEAPLIIDAIYRGGIEGNAGDDPISKLLEGVGNSGGFRIARKTKINENMNDAEKSAYVVLYTSGSELEWPDYIDTESGIFQYYGDNRKAGHKLHETTKRGNSLLRDTFNLLSGSDLDRSNIPPFLIFQKSGKGRTVRFLGLAAPGRLNSNADNDLVAIWRSTANERFQNYKAFFTILDTRDNEIPREWLKELRKSNPNAHEYSLPVWKEFIKLGNTGIIPLKSPRVETYRKKEEQLPSDKIGRKLLNTLFMHFQQDPFKFEHFCGHLLKLMDRRFTNIDITRPWRDGGRDGMGEYLIGSIHGEKLSIKFAFEAKCHNPESGGIGIRQTSRLISRIKYRQFGILITSSYVTPQAYKEIIEDEHPVLIISGDDIVRILVDKGFSDDISLKAWLNDNFPMKNNS